MRIQVKDFMITSVVTASSDKKIKEIKELMNYNGISSVPIIEYSKQLPKNNVTIKGIITASDLIKNTDENAIVEDIMTTTVHVVHPESSARAAAKMMIKHTVHHIIVMDMGEIVGIISSADFVRLVAEYTLD
jgi:predicted transcriptional regulator